MEHIERRIHGKTVGYLKTNDGQEFLMRESHVANLGERVSMYRLIMKVFNETDDRPKRMRLRLLLWKTIFLRPNAKAWTYERITKP